MIQPGKHFHIAFYRFVRLDDPQRVASVLRELTDGLRGQVLLAPEGINGALSGDLGALERCEHALRTDPRLEGKFDDLGFRRSACLTPPFQRLKVHVRPQILPLGISGVDAVGRRGTQLDPAAWRTLLNDERAVVIDNRNSFEHRLGRFRGAIDPEVGNFRDLPRFIAARAPDWKAEGRPVAMYCTGGIRCEKTAAWMADAFGIEVLQLEGGILRYFAEAENPRHDWQGECFVFDRRIALDADSRETSTTAAEVYAGDPDEAWRLRRAERLESSG